MSKKKIGIIGAGGRGIFCLGEKLVRQSDALNIQVTAICDNNPQRIHEAKEYLHNVAEETEQKIDEILSFTDHRELTDCPEVEWVMITTPQFFHREPFEYALQKDKLLYCDKPMAHTIEDVVTMRDAWLSNDSPGVLLGFTRRYENVWRRAKELCDQGWIGNVKMLLLRSIIPYHTYFHRWFSSEKLSGNVLNEKCSHHFDVLNWFAEADPLLISAMGGRTTYVPKDNMPGFCHECKIDCPYRSGKQRRSQDQVKRISNASINTKDLSITTDKCVFSPDIDIMDHAVVNIEYKNQVKAQLFLSIAGFATDDQETLEVIGDKGKLVLERHSARIVVDYNYGQESMTIDAKDVTHGESHFGADHFLLKQMGELVNKGIKPLVSVNEGYMATLMGRLAVKSCKTHQTMKIDPNIEDSFDEEKTQNN